MNRDALGQRAMTIAKNCAIGQCPDLCREKLANTLVGFCQETSWQAVHVRTQRVHFGGVRQSDVDTGIEKYMQQAYRSCDTRFDFDCCAQQRRFKRPRLVSR